MTDEKRTCGNCACLHTLTKPAIQPPGMSPQEYDALPEKQSQCRLNPPLVVQTQKGRSLIQMPTDESMVCWHWKKPGTLPGD